MTRCYICHEREAIVKCKECRGKICNMCMIETPDIVCTECFTDDEELVMSVKL